MSRLTDLPRAELERIFNAAPFIREIGIRLVSIAPGECETALTIEPRHLQQDGFIHAGVQATLADHTAGGAAATLIGDDQFVLSANFQIHLLRAAKGEVLRCRSKVLKPGSRLSVVESEVYCSGAGGHQLVSKATATIAVLDRGRSRT